MLLFLYLRISNELRGDHEGPVISYWVVGYKTGVRAGGGGSKSSFTRQKGGRAGKGFSHAKGGEGHKKSEVV